MVTDADREQHIPKNNSDHLYDSGLRRSLLNPGSNVRMAPISGREWFLSGRVVDVGQPEKYKSASYAPIVTVCWSKDAYLTEPYYIHHLELAGRPAGEDPNGY